MTGPQRYTAPGTGLWARVEAGLANAEGLRALRRSILGRLPFPVLVSDVSDVVYANWVVPFEAIAHLVPPGVRVCRIGGKVILTGLTYRHGHFGPALAGPLRALFPSPGQSNWRLYVDRIGSHAPAKPTVLFLANLFDSPLYALGTRLFSDAMLSHRAGRFVHAVGERTWTSCVEGDPAVPGCALEGERANAIPELPDAFAPFYSDWREAVGRLCLQEAAIAPVAGTDRLALAGIDLPIALKDVEPLAVTRYAPGDALRRWGATAPPFCFRVPTVRFRAVSERLIRP